MKIPITRPWFGNEEAAAVAERLTSGWLVQGPKVAEFESIWAAYTDAPHARATTSCTTALHLALLSVGVRPGDEVIVPAFTWVATPNAVEYCGARPVFVDIDPPTYNIDPGQLRSAVSARTRAIVPVHEFGLAADMDAVLAVAREHDLAVVEDAACACGTLYRGRHVGTFGDAGCFSFHPRKAITTGEGGMVTTRSAEITRLVEVLRSHGAEESDLARHANADGFQLPEFNLLGFNYRMTDLQGAIGVEQMKRLPTILKARRQVAERYITELQDLADLRLPVEPPGYWHVYQSFVVFVEAGHEERNRIARELQKRGITTRQGTQAVHALAYYRGRYGTTPEDCPHAWAADQQSLSLPVFARMTDKEQSYVVRAVRDVLAA